MTDVYDRQHTGLNWLSKLYVFIFKHNRKICGGCGTELKLPKGDLKQPTKITCTGCGASWTVTNIGGT